MSILGSYPQRNTVWFLHGKRSGQLNDYINFQHVMLTVKYILANYEGFYSTTRRIKDRVEEAFTQATNYTLFFSVKDHNRYILQDDISLFIAFSGLVLSQHEGRISCKRLLCGRILREVGVHM